MNETRYKLKLSRVRDIGWTLWDPIGLGDGTKNWDDWQFADEYDGYLTRAAGMLRRGATESEVSDYLVTVVREHLGLTQMAGQSERAARTVKALNHDEELWVTYNPFC